MAITYVPFESKSGFRSPGFSVNEHGDITVDGTVVFNNQFNVAPDFTVNGILVIDTTGNTVSLGAEVKHSSLTKVGTLEGLTIDGDFSISQGSTPYVNIVNGSIFIQSVSTVGTLDNIEIGLSNPAPANFTSVNIGPGDSAGELTVQGHAGITQDLLVGGDLSAVGNITVGAAPTQSSHVTRKDYVDSRVAAFSIAFGA